MYVLTDNNGVAICVSETLDHQENGNPLVHNGTLAIAEILVNGEYANVNNVPTDYEDGKYCFDGSVWTRNPEWREPQPSPDELFTILLGGNSDE